MTSHRLLTAQRWGAVVVLACILSAGAGLWRCGFGRHLRAPAVYTRLPTTFSYWDREPVTRHVGLAFDQPGDLEAGRAYQHLSPVWLFLLYVMLTVLRVAGLEYGAGQGLIVVVTFAAVLGLVWWSIVRPRPVAHAPRRDPGSLSMVPALLAFCAVATLPALWAASMIGNPEDQYRCLAVAAVAFISVLDFDGGLLGRAGFVVAAAVAVLAPHYAPFLLVVLASLGIDASQSSSGGLRWQPWRSQFVVLAALTVFFALEPYLMLRLKHWVGVGSSPLFRSGLDGSTQYFTTMAQAVLEPFDGAGRQWRLLPFPVAAAVVAAGTSAFSRVLSARMFRQLLVCATPALFWIVVFPQAVSIHPYIFDFGLLFPPAFCLAFWLAEPEVRGALVERRGVALGLLIMVSGLVMTNYLDLARAGR